MIGGDPIDPNAPNPSKTTELHRHFGLMHAVALNVSMMVGAGVFVTIPLMLLHVPGPYSLLIWVAAGVLMLMDGLVWSELAAALPGSGGSYVYMLECYGKKRWGRWMAFLFVWQFLISGPLEVASGLITMATIATALHPVFKSFSWTISDPDTGLGIVVDPARLMVCLCGLFIIGLLYRSIASLGRLTITVWLGVLAVIGWILVEGVLRFDPAVAFDFGGRAATWPADFGIALGGVGQAMILAMYAYLGYYTVCYIGDEVRDPGRTLPRAIQISSLLACVLFIGLHLAMLGVVSWQAVPPIKKDLDDYSLAAAFMKQIHGDWAVVLVTLLLIWSCFGSTYAGMLGYSRIPYGAARHGHFFAAFASVHPGYRIPHISLLLVGGMTLFWVFFDLEIVINTLLATRILEQFIGQIIGVLLLRRYQPERPRPYRIWLYPLPCLLALVGWLFMYFSAGLLFVGIGAATMAVGTVVFLAWSRWTDDWPWR